MLMTGYSETVMKATNGPGTQDLQELISQCNPGLKWAVVHYFTPDQGAALARATQEHKALAVSDRPNLNTVLKDELWTLRIKGKKVSTDARESIYDHIHGE